MKAGESFFWWLTPIGRICDVMLIHRQFRAFIRVCMWFWFCLTRTEQREKCYLGQPQVQRRSETENVQSSLNCLVCLVVFVWNENRIFQGFYSEILSFKFIGREGKKCAIRIREAMEREPIEEKSWIYGYGFMTVSKIAF